MSEEIKKDATATDEQLSDDQLKDVAGGTKSEGLSRFNDGNASDGPTGFNDGNASDGPTEFNDGN